jgi:hypothetical protein
VCGLLHGELLLGSIDRTTQLRRRTSPRSTLPKTLTNYCGLTYLTLTLITDFFVFYIFFARNSQTARKIYVRTLIVQHVDHNPPKKNVIATKPDVFVLAIGEQKRSWRTQEFIIALVRCLRQNSQLRWCDESVRLRGSIKIT